MLNSKKVSHDSISNMLLRMKDGLNANHTMIGLVVHTDTLCSSEFFILDLPCTCTSHITNGIVSISLHSAKFLGNKNIMILGVCNHVYV